MPDDIQIYQSELTGPELDEALRGVKDVPQYAAAAAADAETAETYGGIVQQNQAAIQAIADNLTAIQNAPGNAQAAQAAATRAEAAAAEAEQSAQQAETWAAASVQIELVWANQNAGASWPGQTLSIANAQSYDFFIITAYTAPATLIPNDGTDGSKYMVAAYNNVLRTREATPTAGGIRFGDGKEGTATNNSILMPINIYGVKAHL